MTGDRGFIRQLVQATVTKAMRDAPIPKLRPGTVTVAGGPKQVSVLMDSSAVTGEAAISAQCVVGRVFVGDRVMVQFSPPHGAFVVGHVQGNPTPTGCKYKRNASTSQANGWSDVDWAAATTDVLWDPYGMHSLTTDVEWFYIPAGMEGLWHFSMQYRMEGDANGQRLALFEHQPSGAQDYIFVVHPLTSLTHRWAGSVDWYCLPGDSIKLQVFHNIPASGALDLFTDSWIACRYDGPVPIADTALRP